MRRDFEALANAVCQPLPEVDRVTLAWSAEATDFIRFNHATVRQATHVAQRYGTVSVVRAARRNSSQISLAGKHQADLQALLTERDLLLAQLPWVPEDAYLQLLADIASTERDSTGSLPDAAEVIDTVTRLGEGTDLVGFYAGGPVSRGFADSRGQHNWHAVESFSFEWCLYRGGDKAVKSTYAGTHWAGVELATRMTTARQQVELLARPTRTLTPGAYRVYLSPVAVADLLGTLGWGGFGHKDLQTGVGSLMRANSGQEAFAAAVTLTEATDQGSAPRFQPDGFVKPAAVELVRSGRLGATLVSPRTSAEYRLPANGSNAWEAPESLVMAGGELADDQVLGALGTGIYISDLHYINYSDRQACRVTGMTRFACFWVENGELAAPIEVMRFDDSLLRMFGSGLVALTRGQQRVPDSASYGERHLGSITAPGAIVEGLRFTL